MEQELNEENEQVKIEATNHKGPTLLVGIGSGTDDPERTCYRTMPIADILYQKEANNTLQNTTVLLSSRCAEEPKLMLMNLHNQLSCISNGSEVKSSLVALEASSLNDCVFYPYLIDINHWVIPIYIETTKNFLKDTFHNIPTDLFNNGKSFITTFTGLSRPSPQRTDIVTSNIFTNAAVSAYNTYDKPEYARFLQTLYYEGLFEAIRETSLAENVLTLGVWLFDGNDK